MIKALKNEFSSFFSDQSNLRAASIYLITSFAIEPIVIMNLLKAEGIEHSVLIALIRLLKIGIGTWVVLGLLSSNIKQRDYTRLIGLYLLFSTPSLSIFLPGMIRTIVFYWREVPFARALPFTLNIVRTIFSIYIYIKIIRRQIDQNLFLLLSIYQIMYIIPRLYYSRFAGVFRSLVIEQPGAHARAIVYLLGFCNSLGIFSILAILFFEVSGRNLFFKGDEKRVINWIGVVLFLIGFRTLMILFSSMRWQSIHAAHIIWGIQSIIAIYLGKRVRTHMRAHV